MIAAVFGVLHFLPHDGVVSSFIGFFWMFMLLFAAPAWAMRPPSA